MSDDQEKQCIYDPLIELMNRFEGVKLESNSANPFDGLSVEEILKKHVVDGIKKNLEADLDSALETYEPLAIVNEILLDGMKTVGILFGSGKMQLPFVLQSAEVMKAAVRYLEPKMERSETSERGSILLATVAGDVHDIGKNLVDIILSNNGYRVVNIGIKQPINSILEAAERHRCNAIGMSGLLVKSTLIMKENLEEMNSRGLSAYPVLLGGAALTRSYVENDLRSIYEGRVFYAQDAFEGLKILEELDDSDLAAVNTADATERVRSHRLPESEPSLYVFDGIKSDVETSASIPVLPFYGFKSQSKIDIFEVYKYINPVALFRGQWQFKRQSGMDNLAFQNWLDENVSPIFENLKPELSAVLKPKAQWGYFPCASEGNDLIIFEENSFDERLRFNFPRQRDSRRLCLADYIKPISEVKNDKIPDVVSFQIVTVGNEIPKYERKLFEAGDYRNYLFAHGMGVESAEALAEYWHRQVRHELGIDADEPQEMKLLFAAKYHGTRYSFGYPACPNLEDQAKLFQLLDPKIIGIELTEEFMMNPEQSTSAIIFHHKDAKYFNIR